MILIEKKRVPLPSHAGKGGAPRKYPWDEMKIGDSFFVKGVLRNSFSWTTRIASARTGFKFASRTMDGGVRVWRIK